MYGIMLGRFSPLHIGHQKVIDQMISDCGIENSLIILGSATNKTTFRCLFPYFIRKQWFKILYPQIKVIPLPDSEYENEWYVMLDDLLNSIIDNKSYTFYTGSEKDVEFFKRTKFNYKVITRVENGISATKVRQMLLNSYDISNVVDKRITSDVIIQFNTYLKKLDSER